MAGREGSPPSSQAAYLSGGNAASEWQRWRVQRPGRLSRGDGEVIGKVDEIFGPINEAYFWIKMLEGIIATWYLPGDKLYIDSAKLLPSTRFLPKPKYDNSSLFSFCCLLTTTLLSQHDNVAMISWYAAIHELNIEFYFIV
ncbi:unnamed protein product [Musa acuminata subsp. malaccensis]|uniref:H/ACA ribonucleoprotein complex subunit n=1 Tax=Musa acuminata subsp. malaccensis TaxID=214687 RepID=A0A804HRE8_MUSAM|nr:unnamed protein product [Musa acuminata subsp. malaccensis]